MVDLKLNIKSIFLAKDRLNELDEIPHTPYGDIDYWKASQLLCEKDGGRMPTLEEIAQLANYLYNTDNIEAKNDIAYLSIDTTKAGPLFSQSPGGTDSSPWFYVWSSEEYSAYYAYNRYFGNTYTGYGCSNRANSNKLAVCLGDKPEKINSDKKTIEDDMLFEELKLSKDKYTKAQYPHVCGLCLDENKENKIGYKLIEGRSPDQPALFICEECYNQLPDKEV